MTSKHQPAPLTPDDVRAFEDILAVFNMPGWKHLERRLRQDVLQAANIRNVKDLNAAKAAVEVLDNILAWPQTWAALYEMAKEGNVEVDGAFQS